MLPLIIGILATLLAEWQRCMGAVAIAATVALLRRPRLREGTKKRLLQLIAAAEAGGPPSKRPRLEALPAELLPQRELYSPYAYYSARPQAFKDLVRFTPEEFDRLVAEFGEHISANRDVYLEAKDTVRRRACKLSVHDRLFLFLRKLASNLQFKDLEMATGWSDSSHQRDFWHIMGVLYTNLYPREVVWRSADERAAAYCSFPGFPTAVAALDAAEQPVNDPRALGEDQYQYMSGKLGQHTMKTMAAVDSQGFCIYVNSGIKGGVQDCTLLRLSQIGLDWDRFLSPGEYILADGIYHPAGVDGRYVLCPFNIRTVRRYQAAAQAVGISAEARAQAEARLNDVLVYNDAQRRGRVVVENFFARVEVNWAMISGGQRWRFCLKRYEMTWCVSAALTNRLMRTNVQEPCRPADWDWLGGKVPLVQRLWQVLEGWA